MNRSLFSSKKKTWQTPKKLYADLHAEFNFDCDPCFLVGESIHAKDMLGSSWGSRCFVNPPYGPKLTGQWVKKAREESLKGKLIVLLLPSRTDTKWFHEILIEGGAEIRFIKGRLYFDDGMGPAPFPSLIAIFNGGLKP
jgi:hypothetical protein